MKLFKQQIRAEGVTLLAWGVILGALGFGMMYLWGSMRATGGMAPMASMLEQMPASIKGLIGDGIALDTVQGWLQGFAFGSWMWLIYLVYVGLFVTGIVTREMDRHTIDFLLAQPITRRQLLLSRWMAMAAALAFVHVMQLGGITLGLLAIGEQPEYGALVLILVNSLLMFLAIGGLLLIISLFIDDYSKGVGITMGVGLALAFYYFSSDSATGVLKTLRRWLPFAFYNPGRILSGEGVPWLDYGVLAAIAVVALAIALYLFDRKQIAA